MGRPLEIRSTATSNQEGVAGEHTFGFTGSVDAERNTSVRVAVGFACLNFNRAEIENLVIASHDVGAIGASVRAHDRPAAGPLPHNTGTGDMVSVDVSFQLEGS